jgi:hypothetical protein
MKRAVLSILLAACGSSYEPTPEPAPVTPKDAATRPPDPPEHAAKKLLRDAAFAEPLVIGPGLWASLMLTERRVKRDALGKVGTASQVMVTDPETLTLDNRTFADAAAHKALLATDTFKGLVNTFSSAPARDATADERKRLQQIVPFEDHQTVAIFELGKRSIIVVVEKEKLFWIDSFDGYCTNNSLCPR